jgi:hypothetical protein
VGCQNYDDQFDSLESQINALASTVAGLSQVQSDLAALANTVASVQSALSSIPSGAEINAAVSEGLAGVQADIDALETALDNVVSADDLTAVSDAISDVAGDVSDILASNNVYSERLVITNQAELDIAMGLGGKIALINNDVEITLDEEMNRADLDSIASRITAVVGAFTYDGDNEDFESDGLTFSKLKSVSKKLVWKTRDDISFPALGSVGSLEIETGDSETITSASFPALTKLPYVSTKVGSAAAAAHTINLADAGSLDLKALVRYTGIATKSQRGITGTDGTATTNTGKALTITLDDEDTTTIDLAALTTEDEDDSDDDVELNLTISGPRTITLSNYAEGALVADDATTVTLPDYKWDAGTSLDDVVTLAVHKVGMSMDLSTGFDDLETLDVRNDAYETKNPAAYTITINSNVESVNINGYFGAFDATGATSLDTLTTAGEIGDVTITTSDINDLVLGHKAWRTLAGTPEATLKLSGNTDLKTITADLLDDVNELHIIDNDKLTTMSFAALAAPSTAAAASATAGTPLVKPTIGIQIYGNAKLTATYQTPSAVGALTTVAEKVTLDQAPASLITWIKAAKAKWGTTGYQAKGQSSKADGTIYIEVDEYTSLAADGESTEVNSAYTVANLYGAATSNEVPGLKAIRSKYVPNAAAGAGTVIVGGVSKSISAGDVTNAVVGLAEFVTDNSAAYSAAGYTVTSQGYGYKTTTLSISGTEAELESIEYGDSVSIKMGGTTVVLTIDDDDAKTAGVQFGGQTLEFDNSAGTGAGTAVTTPTATTSAYVSSSHALITALTWALNQKDKSVPTATPGTVDATSSTGVDTAVAAFSGENYDLGRWTAAADLTNSEIDITFNGVGTNVLNGSIVVEHLDGSLSTEQTLEKSISLLEYAGGVLTFTAAQVGDAYNFSITGTLSGTLLAGTDVEGADGVIYQSATATAKDNDRHRSLDAAGVVITLDNTGDEDNDGWSTSLWQYGIDTEANTAAAAGTTPDKVSKLAAGV